ncbi:MAG: ATP-grasp domain-containing protein, partial [Actinobacteria bacterium]|nr:ATP-grasp domain-containing protein [Actinomycetota bacterium]
CAEVLAPAPGLDEVAARHARDMAVRIAEGLDVTGVLAVEMFCVEGADGVRLSVNELAMRPHNSGHWTIEGSVTSQFEQHLRAVLDLPLGETAARQPWAVMVNLLGSELADPRVAYPRMMAEFPGAKVHLYGKDVRPRRKLGHVTVFGEDLEVARAAAHAAVAYLRGDAVGTEEEA